MSTPPAMTSNRPYLLRALYEWIVDNDMTPYLLVDASRTGVQVPASAVKDGRVVLNIAPRAVAQLDLGDDQVRFMARFGGVSQPVRVPLPAVQAIYAQETGQGMVLPEDVLAGDAADDLADEPARGRPELALASESDGPDDGDDTPPPSPPRRGAHLKIVK
ncbi:ClpXP protease specificity-enhancing factor [Coralloluteibacterium thermophilus]|uniref:ClpXP protease specificity-enhancing factor n=1 Tax=Coralloluteibacterium thermophilum TaxID=2707049 RepID=A0ABV9NLA7_9GAMM